MVNTNVKSHSRIPKGVHRNVEYTQLYTQRGLRARPKVGALRGFDAMEAVLTQKLNGDNPM
eukprot:4672084-Pyramimonas_sp.AAC.1